MGWILVYPALFVVLLVIGRNKNNRNEKNI